MTLNCACRGLPAGGPRNGQRRRESVLARGAARAGCCRARSGVVRAHFRDQISSQRGMRREHGFRKVMANRTRSVEGNYNEGFRSPEKPLRIQAVFFIAGRGLHCARRRDIAVDANCRSPVGIATVDELHAVGFGLHAGFRRDVPHQIFVDVLTAASIDRFHRKCRRLPRVYGLNVRKVAYDASRGFQLKQ